MIVIIYFLKHIIMMTGLKNNELTDRARKSDKEESLDLSDMPSLLGDE